jgi:hypothetical protein
MAVSIVLATLRIKVTGQPLKAEIQLHRQDWFPRSMAFVSLLCTEILTAGRSDLIVENQLRILATEMAPRASKSPKLRTCIGRSALAGLTRNACVIDSTYDTWPRAPNCLAPFIFFCSLPDGPGRLACHTDPPRVRAPRL